MQKDLENITSKEVSGEGAAPEALLHKVESSVGREKRPKEKISRGFLVFFLPTQIRTELEMQMVCNLREFKEFIDNEMIVILGQMDSPTQIFDHVFLVSLTASSTEFQLGAHLALLTASWLKQGFGGTSGISKGEGGWSRGHIMLSKTHNTRAVEHCLAVLSFTKYQLICSPCH